MPFILVPKPGQDVCDFCTSVPVVKIYSCHNFLVPGTKHLVFQHESVGGWTACSRCSQLIDERKWRQLTDRAVRRFMKLHGLPSYEYADLREQFKAIHNEFKKHMIMPV